MKNHTEAFMKVKEALLDPEVGVIQTLEEVSAIATGWCREEQNSPNLCW